MSQPVQKNASTATQRYLYFFLVDDTDGITAETGEAGGQPEVSVNGGAWAGSSSIGTLNHIGSGHYYAEVAQSVINISSGIILGRYKSANTAEAPSLNQLQVVEHEPHSDPNTAYGKLGAFSTTGVQTLYGHLAALMQKSASTPSGLGTYAAAADSNEVISESLASAKGTGFNQLTDSLEEIRDAIDALDAITTATITLSIAAGSFTNNIIAWVRKFTDEPDVNAKYADSDILALMGSCWQQLWTDLLCTEDHAPLVRWDLTVVANVLDYTLPADVGHLERISKINTSTDTPQWELYPVSRYNPLGPGFKLEGNVIRLTPTWTAGETLRVEYVPGGSISPLQGTCEVRNDSAGDLKVVEVRSVTVGSYDQRENSYAGYMIRITEASPQSGMTGKTDERIVASCIQGDDLDGGGDHITLRSPLTSFSDGDGASTGLSFELIPAYGPMLQTVWSLHVARLIIGAEGNLDRLKALTQLYAEGMRNLRLEFARMQQRRTAHMEGDVPENPRYRTRFPWGA